MPKPKPTEVIVHRIDLQPSVKDSMDAFLIGKTVTNLVAAAGSVVAALGPALGVIATWWLADRAIDEVVDTLTGAFKKKGEEIVEERYSPQMGHYRLVLATLESCADNADFRAQYDGVIKIIKGTSNFNPVFDAFVRFKNKIKSDKSIWMDPAMWGIPMAMRFKAFYPLNALMDEIKEDMNSMGGQVDKMPWPVGWIWKKATNQ